MLKSEIEKYLSKKGGRPGVINPPKGVFTLSASLPFFFRWYSRTQPDPALPFFEGIAGSWTGTDPHLYLCPLGEVSIRDRPHNSLWGLGVCGYENSLAFEFGQDQTSGH